MAAAGYGAARAADGEDLAASGGAVFAALRRSASSPGDRGNVKPRSLAPMPDLALRGGVLASILSGVQSCIMIDARDCVGCDGGAGGCSGWSSSNVSCVIMKCAAKGCEAACAHGREHTCIRAHACAKEADCQTDRRSLPGVCEPRSLHCRNRGAHTQPALVRHFWCSNGYTGARTLDLADRVDVDEMVVLGVQEAWRVDEIAGQVWPGDTGCRCCLLLRSHRGFVHVLCRGAVGVVLLTCAVSLRRTAHRPANIPVEAAHGQESRAATRG